MSVSGRAEDWPYLLSVYALLVIICLPLLFILPESPKYLFVVKKNEERALKGKICINFYSILKDLVCSSSIYNKTITRCY